MKTKQQLINYIKSLGKNPGEYSRSEYYEIGKFHKELEKSEKNWSELTKLVGWRGTADSYRSFINRTSASNTINFGKDFEDDYSEKTQFRDYYNSYRAMIRSNTRFDALSDKILSAISKLKLNKCDSNMVIPAEYAESNTEAILMLSDLHLGIDCSNFYNTYNVFVAQQRMKKLATEIINYCKKFSVARLNVVNLGDAIHGIIHTTCRISEQIDLVDQIVGAAHIIADFLSDLRNNLDCEIIYRSCTDNHSRAVANKDDNIESENLSRLIDVILEGLLYKQKISVDFINDNLDYSLGKFDLLNSKKVMFAHGHLENINKCMEAFTGATKEYIDYILLGHYHASEQKPVNGGTKIFINGSIAGTEQYAFNKRLFSPAEQKLLIFDNDNVIDLNINLQNI